MDVMYSPGSRLSVLQVIFVEVPIASKLETSFVAVSTSFTCSPVIRFTFAPLTVASVKQLTSAVIIVVLLRSAAKLAPFENEVRPVAPP